MLRLQLPSGLSKGGSGQSGWSCTDPPKSSEAASEALSLLSGAIQRTALLKGCCQSNLTRRAAAAGTPSDGAPALSFPGLLNAALQLSERWGPACEPMCLMLAN